MIVLQSLVTYRKGHLYAKFEWNQLSEPAAFAQSHAKRWSKRQKAHGPMNWMMSKWITLCIPAKQVAAEYYISCLFIFPQEFFFKCSGHVTEENESLPPLRMVVTNTRNIPCIVCFDNDRWVWNALNMLTLKVPVTAIDALRHFETG